MKGTKWKLSSYKEDEPLKPQWYWAIVLKYITVKTFIYKTINKILYAIL
jgi:hypothetical protein